MVARQADRGVQEPEGETTTHGGTEIAGGETTDTWQAQVGGLRALLEGRVPHHELVKCATQFSGTTRLELACDRQSGNVKDTARWWCLHHWHQSNRERLVRGTRQGVCPQWQQKATGCMPMNPL